MCGIIGWVGHAAPAHIERVRAARDTMSERGPDDAGLFADDFAVLGARRLAILDLSPSGHMPMSSDDGRHVLVFNGAIYNYVELRAELARELPFRSSGDTEVILNGFRAWGFARLLDRLDGMFAFALWDARTRRLHAARDRLGEKPFFYADSGTSFAFASTLLALARLSGGAPRVSARALDAFLTYQAVPSPLAMFEGMAQLPPAHALEFDADRGTLELSRYWDVPFAPKRHVVEADAVETIDGMMRTAVRLRLRSDVPTGTLLSGGVDSSVITALASQESATRPMDSVTMGYDEAAFDERRHARAVAARYGVRLHESVLAATVISDLPAIVAHYGQPIADTSIVPHYYTAAAARRTMKVALVGDGADELFGGYARPMIERAAMPYRHLVPAPLRRGLRQLLGETAGTPPHGALRRRAALLAAAGATHASHAYVYDRAFRQLRGAAYTDEFMTAIGDWHPDSLYASAWARAVGEDDVDRALYGDLVTYLPDQLLAKSDVSSMAHGLETRSPFLARDVVEYAATLPTELRLHRFTTKYLLKRVAERYVPRSVVYRPKQGFVMPVSSWLRGDLAPHARALLDSPRFLDRGWLRPDLVRRLLREHQSGTHDWAQQLWTLLVLETWARTAIDDTPFVVGATDAMGSQPSA